MLSQDHDACRDIKSGSENLGLSEMDIALNSLIQALIDHEAGTSGQAFAWEAGIARMPQQLRHLIPTLSSLNEFAQKAWPEIKE